MVPKTGYCDLLLHLYTNIFRFLPLTVARLFGIWVQKLRPRIPVSWGRNNDDQELVSISPSGHGDWFAR